MPREAGDILQDGCGRTIDYLRLSLTDRCNLQCRYCCPPHPIRLLDRSEICSFSELLDVVRVAGDLGIRKIRVTGGEPLLRKGSIEFLSALSRIETIEEIALTTNGTLLGPHLRDLKQIGIRRINISLDTLSEEAYVRITGNPCLPAVLEAVDAACRLGFRIKVNMVVIRGVNDREIPEFLAYFCARGIEVRFIEFMPLCGGAWRERDFLSLEEIKSRISQRFALQPLGSAGVAREFQVSDGNGLSGKIGIIPPVTRSFCGSCSRIRISASGELRPCLFSSRKIPLLPILRGDRDPARVAERIREAFRKAVQMKPPSWKSAEEGGDVSIRKLGG